VRDRARSRRGFGEAPVTVVGLVESAVAIVSERDERADARRFGRRSAVGHRPMIPVSPRRSSRQPDRPGTTRRCNARATVVAGTFISLARPNVILTAIEDGQRRQMGTGEGEIQHLTEAPPDGRLGAAVRARYRERALLLWPGLDRAALTRTRGLPDRIARLVARRSSLPLDVIVAMVRDDASAAPEAELDFVPAVPRLLGAGRGRPIRRPGPTVV
jgi:hypothetical protein